MQKIKHVQVRLENTKGNHFKFWSATLKNRIVRVFWGRIGSWTQSKKFAFESNADAMDFLQMKMGKKLRRGYINVTVAVDPIAT
jgi:predicted DNA-binding WGR domain protein